MVTDLKRIIAYSTMSQIGYMIVAVSIGAYSAGLFHLMTHAFFKALLFMAAGLDHRRDGGAPEHRPDVAASAGRCRSPRVVLIIGCLALAGFPGMSGFFSKDEIIGVRVRARRDVRWIFAIGGVRGGLPDRLLLVPDRVPRRRRRPVPEAKELEEGHLAHGEHQNPATGEREDTDVGFPGAEHHIAEREWPMKVPMAILAFLSIFGGRRSRSPGSMTRSSSSSRAASRPRRCSTSSPRPATPGIGLAIGGVISIAGIALAFYCYVLRPGVTVRLAERLRPIHTFLINKWYFDELFDALVYRPVIGIGRFANNVVERVLVNGMVSTTTEIVRGFGSVVRGAQTGFVRAYALLLITGFAALGLYFLVVSS